MGRGEVVGLFKPFDEEIYAPNNPLGPDFRSPLGDRTGHVGIRVGEAVHREVAAFCVDAFFGFGIVPKTYYASFIHPAFFLSTEKREEKMRPKMKMGLLSRVCRRVFPLSKRGFRKMEPNNR